MVAEADKLDKRLVRRQIERGTLAPEAWEKHLAALPDLAEASTVFTSQVLDPFFDTCQDDEDESAA